MSNLNTWQNLFKSRKKLHHVNNRESIDNHDFFFLCDEKTILRNLENLIKEKDEQLSKLRKEDNNDFKIRLLSSDFVNLKSTILTLQLTLEEKVTKKIEQLEKNKINKFKNLMIKIFTFWKKDKNKFIKNKIIRITLDSKHIKNNCKKLNDHLIHQQEICTNLIIANELDYQQSNLTNKNKTSLLKM